MYERFTDRARKVMRLAEHVARQLNHQFVGDEHLLLGMLAEGDGVVGHVLKNAGLDLEKTRSEIWEWEPALPDDNARRSNLPLTNSAKHVLEEAFEACRKLEHNYIGTEHLLLGLCRRRDTLSARVLSGFGVELEAIRRQVLE